MCIRRYQAFLLMLDSSNCELKCDMNLSTKTITPEAPSDQQLWSLNERWRKKRRIISHCLRSYEGGELCNLFWFSVISVKLLQFLRECSETFNGHFDCVYVISLFPFLSACISETYLLFEVAFRLFGCWFGCSSFDVWSLDLWELPARPLTV